MVPPFGQDVASAASLSPGQARFPSVIQEFLCVGYNGTAVELPLHRSSAPASWGSESLRRVLDVAATVAFPMGSQLRSHVERERLKGNISVTDVTLVP